MKRRGGRGCESVTNEAYRCSMASRRVENERGRGCNEAASRSRTERTTRVRQLTASTNIPTEASCGPSKSSRGSLSGDSTTDGRGRGHDSRPRVGCDTKVRVRRAAHPKNENGNDADAAPNVARGSKCCRRRSNGEGDLVRFRLSTGLVDSPFAMHPGTPSSRLTTQSPR